MIRSCVVLVLGLATATALAAQAAPATPAAGTAASRGPSAMPPADSTRTVRKPPRSWTTDRRDFAVGDIITILVDENTAASANKATVATDRKSRKMGFDATLPAPATGKNIGIQSNNDGDSRQDGRATRGNNFVGEISVKVMAISKEGNLQVKGTKTVDVDKNKQTMTLSGWLRPQDVSTTDYAASSRVADAEIVYQAQGSLGKPRSGILTRVLGVVWP
jgi:flagellar L-ring protein precursor FlgH